MVDGASGEVDLSAFLAPDPEEPAETPAAAVPPVVADAEPEPAAAALVAPPRWSLRSPR
jgi:hypothetical protein